MLNCFLTSRDHVALLVRVKARLSRFGNSLSGLSYICPPEEFHDYRMLSKGHHHVRYDLVEASFCVLVDADLVYREVQKKPSNNFIESLLTSAKGNVVRLNQKHSRGSFLLKKVSKVCSPSTFEDFFATDFSKCFRVLGSFSTSISKASIITIIFQMHQSLKVIQKNCIKAPSYPLSPPSNK